MFVSHWAGRCHECNDKFLLLEISAIAMGDTLECCGICLKIFPHVWKFQISGLPWTCCWNSQKGQQSPGTLEPFSLQLLNNSSDRLTPVFMTWCQPTTRVIFWLNLYFFCFWILATVSKAHSVECALKYFARLRFVLHKYKTSWPSLTGSSANEQ